MIEILAVILIVALLVILAWELAFADEADRAHDSRAQQHMGIALNDLRGQHLMHDRSYPIGPAGEELLAERLEHSNPTFNFHSYEGGDHPSTGDYDFSVTVEDTQMASLCVQSKTTTVFCARNDQLGLLELSDSEWVVEEASDATVSYCAAPSEPQARECLASRELLDVEPGIGDEDPGDEPGPGDEGPGDDPGEPGDEEPGEEDPGEEDGSGGEDPGEDPGEEPGEPGDENPGEPGEDDPPAGPQDFTLYVAVSGDGEGRVVGPGINCPGDCSEVFPAGTKVTLQRQSLNGSSFLGWSEDCSGRKQRCQVEMDRHRFVTAGFLSPDPYENAFGSGDILSASWINMNSNARILGNVHAHTNVTMSANAEICGRLVHGGNFSKNKNATHHCGPRSQAPLYLPPVDQGNANIVNDNAQLPVQGGAWNPATRTLQLNSNSTYTIPEGTYSFCRILLSSNTRIYVEKGDEVTIFFDSPENCNLGSGTAQLTFNSNSAVENADSAMTSPDGFDPKTKLRMLFVGSHFRTTKIHLNSNTQLPESCTVDMDVYAPLTEATMNSNATFCGRLAVKSLEVNSNARLQAP